MTKAAVLALRGIIQRKKVFSEWKKYASIFLSFSDQPTVLSTECCRVITDVLSFSYLLPLIIRTTTTQMERAPRKQCIVIQQTPFQWCNGYLHRSIQPEVIYVSISGHSEKTELTYPSRLIHILLRNGYEHFWSHRYQYSVSIQCYLIMQSLEKKHYVETWE